MDVISDFRSTPARGFLYAFIVLSASAEPHQLPDTIKAI